MYSPYTLHLLCKLKCVIHLTKTGMSGARVDMFGTPQEDEDSETRKAIKARAASGAL